MVADIAGVFQVDPPASPSLHGPLPYGAVLLSGTKMVSFASGRIIPERPTRNGSGEMARVVCTLHGKRLDGGVSVLSVGVNPF